METVLVIDVIELYTMIGGLIVVSIILLGMFIYWLWDEYLSYFIYHLKKKFKKV